MSEKSNSVNFEVVGLTKSLRKVRGKRKLTYQVSLKSVDGSQTHTLTGESSALFEKYPYGSIVSIAIGHNPQTTLPKTS